MNRKVPNPRLETYVQNGQKTSTTKLQNTGTILRPAPPPAPPAPPVHQK